MISVNDSTLQRHLFSGGEENGPSVIFRPPLQLKDGYISASIALNFEKTVTAIGMPELLTDPLFDSVEKQRENMVAYVDIVSAWARDKRVSEVAKIFDAHDIPYGSVASPAEVVSSAHVQRRDMLANVTTTDGVSLPVVNSPYRYKSGKSHPPGGPPALGEQSRQILAEVLGLADAEIDQLVEAGIVQEGSRQ